MTLLLKSLKKGNSMLLARWNYYVLPFNLHNLWRKRMRLSNSEKTSRHKLTTAICAFMRRNLTQSCIYTSSLTEQSKTTSSLHSKLKSLNGLTKVWRRQPKDKTCVNSSCKTTSAKSTRMVSTIYNLTWLPTTMKTKKGIAKNAPKTEKILKLTSLNLMSFGTKPQ